MADAQEPTAYDAFLDAYANDPVLMVREVFGADPDDWQIELMNAVRDGKRKISARSGHGVGKSTVLSWLIIWHVLTKYPQKTVATAPTSTQLFDALASETKAWVNRLPDDIKALLRVTEDRIVLVADPDASFVSFATSRAEKPEALQGKHSENVLLIADEASGIPQAIFVAAQGSMSGHNATTILCGNPVRSTGLFYDTHHTLRAFWHTIHISSIKSKRVSRAYIEEMKEMYGEDSNEYRVRVLGEFPRADDDTIISRELMEPALDRDVEPTLVKPIWGLDVARSLAGDHSALAKRKGNVLAEKVKRWQFPSLTQLIGRVKHEWDETLPPDRPSHICVDSIGLGAGVADRLLELGLPALAVNVSEAPPVKGTQYANLKAELWYRAYHWLETLDSNLANDVQLGEQLVIPKKDFTSSGKTKVESKQALKARGVKSPDVADAFILTFAVDAVSSLHGSSKHIGWGVRRPSRGIGIV